MVAFNRKTKRLKAVSGPNKKAHIASKVNLPGKESGTQPAWVWFLAFGGWLVCFWALLALQDFQTIAKTYFWIDKPNRVPLGIIITSLTVGFSSTVYGLRRLGKGALPQDDMGRGMAWSLLALVLTFASFLCLYEMGDAPGSYWDDWANNFVLARLIVDTHMLKIMLPFGGHEPFFDYLTAGVHYLLPDFTGVETQRVTGAAVHLLTVWALYLAGREAVSRRAGVVAAAMGAVSKPILILSFTGMRACSLALAVSLLIVATLRVVKRPNLGRQIQWGLAFTFGVHTYSAFRPFMMIVPFFLLVWILWRREERRDPVGWGAAAAAAVLLAAIYGDMFASIHPSLEAPGKAWGKIVSNGWIFLAMVSAWAGLAVWAVRRSMRGKPPFIRLAGWAVGLGLACLLVYPISRTYDFNERFGVLSIFRMVPEAQTQGAWYVLSKCWQAVQNLFWVATDRNDLTISIEPYYDVFTQGMVLMAVALWVSKPVFQRTLLALFGFLGCVALVFSIDPSTLKIVASVPPLLVLGAAGVDRLWRSVPWPDTVRPFFLGFLCFMSIWGGKSAFHKMHDFYLETKGPNNTVADLIRKDCDARRVYIAQSDSFIGMTSQFALNSWRRYYYLKETNFIPVKPGFQPEDVVILVAELDVKEIERLRGLFPRAEWSRHLMNWNPGIPGNTQLFLHRVLVEGRDLNRAGRLFRIEERDGRWTRRLYSGLMGWGKGGILRERLVHKMSDPVPLDDLNRDLFQNEYVFPQMAALTGLVELDQPGLYEWRIDSVNPVWILADKKTLFKTIRTDTHQKVVRRKMKAGTHVFEARVRFHVNGEMLGLSYRKSGETEWKEL